MIKMEKEISAFPRNFDIHGTSGMTLRDYFAAKAMAAYMLNHPNCGDEIVIARCAYILADAMIDARNQK